MTISTYYADPDGNQMEFQVDAFDSAEEGNAFAGASLSDFLIRHVHEPVSPTRGALASV